MIKTGANAQDERVRPFSIQQQQHSWKEAQGTAVTSVRMNGAEGLAN